MGNKRYLVHVYFVQSGAVDFSFITRSGALKFANDKFEQDDVYKVKVWDLHISNPVPNVEEHPALILHLV